MTDPRTTTVEHPEHGEIEITVPETYVPREILESDYVPKGAHNSQMAQLRKQYEGFAKPDDLLSDEEFRNRAIEEWGIEIDDGAPKLTPDRVAELRSDFERKHLKPMQDQLSGVQKENESLRTSILHSRILAAAGGKVQQHLLKAPSKGAMPPIVNLLAPYFTWDADSGIFAVREGDGFRTTADPEASSPYMGIDEFVARWIDDEENPFRIDTRQSGPGAGVKGSGGSGSGGSGVVTLSYEDSQDPTKYRAAKKVAEERGVELVIGEHPSWRS